MVDELRREVEVARSERDAAFAALQVQGSPRQRRPSHASWAPPAPFEDSTPEWMLQGVGARAGDGAGYGPPAGLPFHHYGEPLTSDRSPPTPPRLPFPVGIGYVPRGSRFEEHTEFVQHGALSGRSRGPASSDDPELAIQFVGMERPFTAFPTFDRVAADARGGAVGSPTMAGPPPSPPPAYLPVQAQVQGQGGLGLGYATVRPSSGASASPFSGVSAAAGAPAAPVATGPPLQTSTFVPTLPVGPGTTPRRQLLEVEQSMVSSRQLLYATESPSPGSGAVTGPHGASTWRAGSARPSPGGGEGNGVVPVPSPGSDEDYSHDFSEGAE
jgi:hypothetical protein